MTRIDYWGMHYDTYLKTQPKKEVKRENYVEALKPDELQNQLKGDTKQAIYPGTAVEVKEEAKCTIKNNEVEQGQTEQTEKTTSAFDSARKLYTKKQRKAAVKEYQAQFLENGTADGQKNLDEKTAKRYAKNYVANEYNKENSQHTEVFMDKSEFRAAKQENRQKYRELKKEYKNLGLSGKDARQEAKAQLTDLEYLRKCGGQRKTRKYIENNRPEFYDNETGKFSNDKFKEKAIEFANKNTTDKEVENYYLSLKERRQSASDEGVNASVVKNFAKKSNIGYEKDYTALYKTLTVLGTTALGVAAGPLFGSSAAAAASSAAAVDGASAAASAAAAASVNGGLIGGGVGLGLGTGLSALIKDKGGIENKVYAPKTEAPQVAVPPKEEIIPDKPCELTFDSEKLFETKEEVTCEYTLKKGQTLYDAVRDGYGLKNHKEIMEFVHHIKDRYGINYNVYTPRTKWEMPEINGKTFNCDVEVKGTCKDFSGKGTEMGSFKKKSEEVYKGSNYWSIDCNGNKTTYESEADLLKAKATNVKAIKEWNNKYANK